MGVTGQPALFWINLVDGKEKEMKKFIALTLEQFVEKLKAEEIKRDKVRHKAKGVGSRGSILRYNRRHR